MKNGNYTIKLTGGLACNETYRFKEPIDLCIGHGQQVAIIGPNASGKSLLVNTLLRQYPLMDNRQVEYGCGISGSDIRFIAFRDSYGSADSTYFYQQRWNMTEMGESPVVSEAFSGIADSKLRQRLFNLFELKRIWDKQLVTLSSGEMRKYQLARTIAAKPRIIILDSPFIGLDAETRIMLCNLLETLINEWGIQIILVVSRRCDIPSFITHVICVNDRICYNSVALEEYLSTPEQEIPHPILSDTRKELIKSLPSKNLESGNIVKCNKVTLQYGSRRILDNLDWTVNKGEHWALLGPNGSGKSALLSLIYADNPQSYACDIALFGRSRGTGESIWEIKKHIGYVSPEMHRSYTRHYPAIDIVASGLHDTIGLYKKITQEERDACHVWMDIFGVRSLEDRDFYNLSSGEQRLILLTRAFVKNPSLLILDEPLHGLDLYNRTLALEIIKVFAAQNGKTLIIVTHYPEELEMDSFRTFTLVRH